MRLITCLLLVLMLSIGFAPAQSTKQAGTKVDGTFTQATGVTGLQELSHDKAVMLQPVPDSQLLATQIRQLAPVPQGPHQLCAADASVTIYEARINTSITVCGPLAVSDTLVSTLVFRSSKPTRTRLTDPAVFQSANLKTFAKIPYTCATSDGPWTARIFAERRCIGSCSPHNHLFVVGVPNTVEFDWYGSLDQHPPGFTYVGRPTQIDHQSYGQCNGMN